jgi:glycosyltransferase involved in cell wall biosynthesis
MVKSSCRSRAAASAFLTVTTLLMVFAPLTDGFGILPYKSQSTTSTSTRTRTRTLLEGIVVSKGKKKKTLRSSTTALFVIPKAHKVQMAKQSDNFLRGKIMLLAHKFLVPPAVYYAAIQRIISFTYWPEVVIIVAMVNVMPITQWYYLRQQRKILRRKQHDNDHHHHHHHDHDHDQTAEHDKERQDILHSFVTTKRHKIALVIEQFGRLQSTLYLSDVLLVFLKILNFDFVVKYQAQRIAGSIIFSTWLARNLSRIKFHYLSNGIPSWSISAIRRRQRQEISTNNNNNTTNKPLGTYNRFANKILDVLIYLCAFLAVIDLLGIQIGFAITSIFGLGSFGTLVLSLASKDVAAEFVGGLMIQSSNFFEEGESVILQDGVTGVVVKIGWLVSQVRCSAFL